MIRGINIAINAAHPELPLVEATTFVGSPSSVFVRGVPKSCGNWRITAVSVVVTYPDNTTTTRVAVESAQGVWVATIPGTATSGRTVGGFRILADGEDENGAAITGYVLGFADFAVFSMLPVPAPGETFYLFRYFDEQPATPKKGDAAIIGGVLKYYNGTAWTPFADLSNYYTKGETDEAIERVAAYYITADAQGRAFATYAALVSASTYYSGGVARVPTRNDYAVVLADETHDGAEYRYIYAIADGATTGQWEAQYPIETNDYIGLSNKPSINSVALAGNKTGAQLGLANSTDLTPLQLAALYPEGDVKSASEWATPWNGSTGIKYELDAATHTAAILTFSKTTNTANDNSHLTGRVVIPPFIESNGERYTVASIKNHSGGGLPTYDLTEVVAPTTLETIGRFAFYFCMGLKRAYFPRASQLKYNAFQDCRALEYISIPNVSNVPTQCFINDSSLKGLTIPNAESILLGGLSGCAALEVVNFGSVARSAVPTFYNNSFYNVPVTCKIIIPDSQYDAWIAASGWSTLYANGYQFLKHSEWEYARRYELAAKQGALSQTQLANIAAVSDALAFDATYLYAAGDPVVYNGTLYTFTATHTGAWTGSDVSAVDIIARLAGKLDKSGGEMTPTFISGVIPPGKVVFGTDAAGPYIGIAHGQNTVLLRPSQIEFDGRSAALAASPATAGNLAALDANGNPTDSTIPAANVAVKGEIPYILVTKTISNNAVTLDDRASNAVTVSATLSPNTLTINFPTAPTGKLRDFAMRLNIAAGVTAPEIAWPQGVTLENNGGEVPEIADGGTGGSSTILYFSESENNGTTAKFTVKGETLTAIAQA